MEVRIRRAFCTWVGLRQDVRQHPRPFKVGSGDDGQRVIRVARRQQVFHARGRDREVNRFPFFLSGWHRADASSQTSRFSASRVLTALRFARGGKRAFL
eukprot:841352-Lingulodinium_polyedra.AAC.1